MVLQLEVIAGMGIDVIGVMDITCSAPNNLTRSRGMSLISCRNMMTDPIFT